MVAKSPRPSKAKRVKPFRVPSPGEAEEWFDSRGVEYSTDGSSHHDVLAPSSHLTTHELANELGMYPESMFRWCRKWFGPLPKGRAGARMGYRIPVEYRRVSRAWLLIESPTLREVIRRSLVTDPKDWVVVVANVGSTHYTVAEVVGRVESILQSSIYHDHPVTLVHVGPADATSNQKG